MRTLTIIYIVIQIVCLAVGAALFAIVVNGTRKPKCSCPNGANVITGKSCKDLAGMPEMQSYCNAHCGSNTRYVNGCSWLINGQYGSCVKCRGLDGKPLTYWIVGAIIMVLPAAFFIPMIVKKRSIHKVSSVQPLTDASLDLKHHSQQG